MQNNLFLCTLRPRCAECLSVLTIREAFFCRISSPTLQGDGKYPSKNSKIFEYTTK